MRSSVAAQDAARRPRQPEKDPGPQSRRPGAAQWRDRARGGGPHLLPAWLGSYDSAEEARSLCQVLDLKKAYIAGCTVFKGATLEARAD